MTRSSRKSLAIALILILAVTFFFWRRSRFDPSAAEASPFAPAASRHLSSMAGAAAGESTRPSIRPPRVETPGSRLKSMLDLKKGEFAYFEITPEALAETFGIDISHADSAKSPSLAKTGTLTQKNKEQLAAFAEKGMPVIGNVDTPGEDFLWRTERWKISGHCYPTQDLSLLQMHLELEGGGELLTTVSFHSDGILLLMLPGSGKGILIVAGDQATE